GSIFAALLMLSMPFVSSIQTEQTEEELLTSKSDYPVLCAVYKITGAIYLFALIPSVIFTRMKILIFSPFGEKIRNLLEDIAYLGPIILMYEMMALAYEGDMNCGDWPWPTIGDLFGDGGDGYQYASTLFGGCKLCGD
ncbi:MAG: hypothetical protein JSW62_00445, partial [Thermoplasmatales archaeon]